MEVIALAEGFKDYLEIEVKIKPSSLGIISPKSAANTVNVSYKLNEVSSAYIMILGSYGATVTSNNYISDLNTSAINVSLSNYQNGFYTIVLICNGQIADAKTVIKQ